MTFDDPAVADEFVLLQLGIEQLLENRSGPAAFNNATSLICAPAHGGFVVSCE